MTGVAELFAEYDGSDPDWFQLAWHFEEQERTRNESVRHARRHYQRFFDKTPHGKACAKERKQRWEAKDPAHARAIRLAAQKRWRAKNIEKIRAEDRARKARRAV